MRKIKQTETVTPRHLDAILETLTKSKQYVKGEYNRRVPHLFNQINNLNYNILTNSGTSALYVILKALGLKKGDEVIVPANTFIATANAVVLAGYKVRFIDVGMDYNIDTDMLSETINGHTKAIIVVHLYGRPAKMDKIMKIANDNNLLVIEDCCQAHFSSYKGKKVGTFGIASAFSFFPTKPISTMGEGGMASTNDLGLSIEIRKLVDVGRFANGHERVGMNMRMSEFQAGVLWHNLIDPDDDPYASADLVRKVISRKYYLELKGLGLIMPPKIIGHSNHQFPIFITLGRRDALKEFLAKRGIETSIKYPLIIPSTPAYKDHDHGNELVTRARVLAEGTLCLPIHHMMTHEDVVYIKHSIIDFLQSDISNA